MTARQQSDAIAAAARAAFEQLPPAVLDACSNHGIALLDLARAIGNNAAQAIAFAVAGSEVE